MNSSNTLFFILVLAASSPGKINIKKACTAKGGNHEIELSQLCMCHFNLTTKKGAPLSSSKFMAVRCVFHQNNIPVFICMLTNMLFRDCKELKRRNWERESWNEQRKYYGILWGEDFGKSHFQEEICGQVRQRHMLDFACTGKDTAFVPIYSC